MDPNFERMGYHTIIFHWSLFPKNCETKLTLAVTIKRKRSALFINEKGTN